MTEPSAEPEQPAWAVEMIALHILIQQRRESRFAYRPAPEPNGKRYSLDELLGPPGGRAA